VELPPSRLPDVKKPQCNLETSQPQHRTRSPFTARLNAPQGLHPRYRQEDPAVLPGWMKAPSSSFFRVFELKLDVGWLYSLQQMPSSPRLALVCGCPLLYGRKELCSRLIVGNRCRLIMILRHGRYWQNNSNTKASRADKNKFGGDQAIIQNTSIIEILASWSSSNSATDLPEI